MSHARQIRVGTAAFILVAAVIAASADYVVQRGDTVNQIAAEFGVSADEIVRLNSLGDPDLLMIGQVLLIPGQDGTATHVVAKGDTLAGLAAAYGTTVQALVEANSITNPNLIRPGQELVVPGAGSIGSADSVAPAPVAGATYTVEPGDTLASIADRHGTTVEVIAAANGITNTSIIYVGTVLQLTGSGFVVEAASAPVVTMHMVAQGENLAQVAAKYGTTVDDLVATNSIPNPNLITIGQQLQVPTSGPGWVCPVPGARYFNDWGYPRSGGRFHEGNDLFAPRGTPVLAPVSGTAIFQNGHIGGLQFRFYGDDGTTYIGSHLDTVGADGYYRAGSQLGTVGDSGNAIGGKPHLHFEIHPADGGAVNPYPTLQKFGC
ncbi:MAG TPA: LysM peptidoglycan-binding domain-containing M23 family metallopeptidase [Acidimicrobiia bacterium]